MNPITNVLPLVLVLAVSLAKEGFEDRKRALKDSEVSHQLSKSLRVKTADGNSNNTPQNFPDASPFQMFLGECYRHNESSAAHYHSVQTLSAL